MRPKVNKYLVVVAGPTAVGKTQIAIELATRLQSVIVSADSRQLFREMNIGTAKPSEAERAAVQHYFIDTLSLDEPYSAGRYAQDCHVLLEHLFEQHELIFLVGGAGLYIRAVIEGFDNMPTVSPEIRAKWQQIYEKDGLQYLQEAIHIADPEFAKQVDLKNPRRLVRALSLIETAGIPVTALRRQAREALPFTVLKIFCNRTREELYSRIHARVDAMIAAGLVDEVRSLLSYRDTQAMQTVGYKEIVAYLDGHYSLDEAVAKIKQHSCNYAKRQLTWFRHQGDWTEFNPPEVAQIAEFIHRETSL